MFVTSANPISHIVQQHAEESAGLMATRLALANSADANLYSLDRHDARLAAHVDGMLVAGEYGAKLSHSLLRSAGAGELFLATILAVTRRDAISLDHIIRLAQATPAIQVGLFFAFVWSSSTYLSGTIKELLNSPNAFQRMVSFATCSSHQVDPGEALQSAINDDDSGVRAMALRVAGEVGRRDLRQSCISSMDEEDIACRFWAARSGALLGAGNVAISALQSLALSRGPYQEPALRLALKMASLQQGHALLKALAREPANPRLLVAASGASGDPQYVPWLIKQLGNPKLSRLAGEALQTMTGIDVAMHDMGGGKPDGADAGPTDDPNDNAVALDDDEGLPWPDPTKVQQWWDAHQHEFSAGQRYFIGKPPTKEHCRRILSGGSQRQRAAAAEYLCLLQPGTKLFPTSAPAWRQQRWLKQMQS